VTLRQLVENQRAKDAGIAPVHDMRKVARKQDAVTA
jgi:hypothetical protein